MVDLDVVVSDFVENADCPLPFVYVWRDDESGRVNTTEADAVECFMDYLSGQGFLGVLDDEPSAITRMDMWFEMFVEDAIEPVDEGGDE